MITIKQIEAFYWAAKLGTVQRAATKLYVTQSAATKRIQELERISAVPLFEISGRKAELTAKGKELFELSESFLAATSRLDEVRTSTKHVARILHVGVVELIALTWFADFARQLATIYPNVTLHPDVDLSATLREKLHDGRLDFAVIPESWVEPSMAWVRLGMVQFTWICAPGTFPDKKVTLQDLASHPLIDQGPRSELTLLCESIFAQAGLAPTRVAGSTSLAALAGLVEAGLGISCVPQVLCQAAINKGRLQVIQTDPPAPSIAYVGAFLKGHQASLGYALADIATQCCDFDA